MKKGKVNSIAKALIAQSGLSFDSFAFEDCRDLITEDEKEQIIKQIQVICNKELQKLFWIYNKEIGPNTKDIVKVIKEG